MIPRFITEYANYKKNSLKNLIKEYPNNKNIFLEKIADIDRTIKNRSKGIITIDETMKILSKI